MNRNTEEGRLAHNAYMRGYYKTRPEQRVKARIRKNESNARLKATDPVGYAGKKAAETRRRRWANPIAVKNEQIKHKFNGLTLVQYDVKLASQKGICFLCYQPFDVTVELLKPVLDHNYVTGQIRDFVHRCCNLAIEHLQEKPANARLAAEYLEHHSLEEEA